MLWGLILSTVVRSQVKPLPPLSAVPAAVVEATFADVSPTSVLALWALPERDPGAPITEVLIQYRNVDIGETWDQARSITVNDISNESSNITGLSPRTQYQLQVTPGNWIGLGEPVATPTFRTQPPGFPGSVHQLSAKNISTNQLALCWVASSTGAHTEYYIKAISLNVTVENRTWIFSVGNSGLMRFSNGTEAAVVGNLLFTTCTYLGLLPRGIGCYLIEELPNQFCLCAILSKCLPPCSAMR